jgi:Mrp family chromosome partitioning ATPase
VLANQVDGILVIAEAGRTRRPELQHTVENLQKVGGNVVGVVLNRSRRGQLKGYGSYYHMEDRVRDGKEQTRQWYRRVPVLNRLFAR